MNYNKIKVSYWLINVDHTMLIGVKLIFIENLYHVIIRDPNFNILIIILRKLTTIKLNYADENQSGLFRLLLHDQKLFLLNLEQQ